MTRQTNFPWKCTVGDCVEEAKYHIGGDGKHDYFCQGHWSHRLGYRDKHLNKIQKSKKRKIT